MRRARLTYKGAYHHIMSRGLNGLPILAGYKAKQEFLSILAQYTDRFGIDLYAYCLMSNHYHLVLRNRSGRLSDFMKQVNGDFGLFYRRMHGGRGYVFQGRFKSTLIENDIYLKMVIIYILLNPVRACLVKNPLDYKWSSAHVYFSRQTCFMDCGFVEDLFGSRQNLYEALKVNYPLKLPIQKVRLGEIIGDEDFYNRALELYERRHRSGYDLRQRHVEKSFESVDKIITEFEGKHHVQVKDLGKLGRFGKQLRAELLIMLRDRCGLYYREIIKLAPFRNLKLWSLAKIYERAKSTDEDS